MAKIERALLSVSDKTGLVPFAQALAARGIELVSTGGTARALAEAGLTVVAVSELTGFPEMMDGRVKTLHPAVHGGILARRDHPADLESMEQHGIAPIDLVVVNLYPFEATVSREGASRADAIEQIDIGGPSMVRSSAKNNAFVGIVTDPADYAAVTEALEANDGHLPSDLRLRLAQAAFQHTARYDAAIAAWLGGELDADEGIEAPVPRLYGRPIPRREVLRYGENPHQAAGLYVEPGEPVGLVRARQLQGKELSYNNWLDMDAAFTLARDLGPTGIAVIKHTNPCGAARSNTSLLHAWEQARACDPVSAFGGIVATSGVIDGPLATSFLEGFLEVVLAAEVTDEAREIFARKKNLRVLTLDEVGFRMPERTLVPRPVSGGLLVQEADLGVERVRDGQVVTERAPTDAEWDSLDLAWMVAKHVKSNAIIFAFPDRIAAIGAGQMSRVDSSRIAVFKATTPLAGSAMASDAFFPFADGVEAGADAGATAVVQPGGSIRDAEVIAAANARGLAMVFTGRRHFRH
ncbi:MAG: bifunctional phosphoribosylaminoimidazolecarboxamide formyltransferase/IMP cyclohydrolase [Myxococcota bacterium]